MPKRESTQSIDFDEKIFDHLINCRDIDNLIIKGHLITEHLIDEFIENHSIARVNFNNHKIGYNLKIEIAKILGLFILNENLYQTLIQLNKLRNSIAHSLNFGDELLNSFFQIADPKSSVLNMYEKFIDLSETHDSDNISFVHFRFCVCIASLYGHISEFGNFNLKEIINIKTRKSRIENKKLKKSTFINKDKKS
jgi:hypothetical protein